MKEESFVYSDERFADIQMLRYRLDGFDTLTLQQKKYIYYLSEATLVGRDITTDQFGKYNLSIRRLLEAVYVHSDIDRSTADFKALTVYLKRLWFSSGIHHHYGSEKFVPGFGEAWLRDAVCRLAAQHLVLGSYGSVAQMLDDLCPVIFDPAIMPSA
jgi:dipeptidyl-peptidase-3